MADNPRCELCGSDLLPLTRHHLVPRSKARSRKEAEDPANAAMLCRPCHDAVHALFTDAELAKSYHSIADLVSDPRIADFVDWKRKHPGFAGHSRMANARKKRR